MKLIEIELKYEITLSDIERYKHLLESLGFKEIKRVYEMNVMYDNPSELMKITDGRIRLRRSGEDTILTYKKPITRERIKKEIEYEVGVTDFNKTEKILKMMEFTRTTSYERYRTYLHSSNVEVMIDEFPFSTFIEIEGDEKDVVNISNQLQFNMADNLTDSCDTIYTNRCIKAGIKPSLHILFETCKLKPN